MRGLPPSGGRDCAAARLRCCNTPGPICAHHIEAGRRFLAKRPAIHCGYCAKNLTGLSYDEAIELVPL